MAVPGSAGRGGRYPAGSATRGGQPCETVPVDDQAFVEAWSRGSVPGLGGLLRAGQIRRANPGMIDDPGQPDHRPVGGAVASPAVDAPGGRCRERGPAAMRDWTARVHGCCEAAAGHGRSRMA